MNRIQDLWPALSIVVGGRVKRASEDQRRFLWALSIMLDIRSRPTHQMDLQAYIMQAYNHPRLWAHAHSYSSNPKLWGKYLWMLIHRVADTYTPRHHRLYSSFLVLFAKVLPCDSCRLSFTDIVRKNPLTATDRIGYVNHISALHNIVNRQLHKPSWNKGTLRKPVQRPLQWRQQLQRLQRLQKQPQQPQQHQWPPWHQRPRLRRPNCQC
jgi:hypothetical protein